MLQLLRPRLQATERRTCSRGKYIRASLDGEPQALMLASGSGVLRSIDGRVWMRIGGNGTQKEITVVLSGPDGGQRMAGGSATGRR